MQSELGPEISVVLPVFNGEEFLAQAIESVLTQTHPVKEIIVVDDGSTDQSLSLARRYEPRVRCISQQNQGASAARNAGIAAASGEWIAFLDADDYWLPSKIERQVAVIKEFPAAGLIYAGRLELEDGSFKKIEAKPPAWVKERILFENPLYPNTVLVRRSLMLKEPWNVKLNSSTDWNMFYRLSKLCDFACVKEPLSVYRRHNASLTNRNWRSVLHNARKVAREIRQDQPFLKRRLLHAKVHSRLSFSAAISAREQGSSEYFKYIAHSLITWPFPEPGRYKLFARMFVQRFAGR